MQETKELISVIVPIYNIDRYVGLCVESLIRQTYHELEIILVDDGSTDCSGALCDLYAAKDSRIKVIHKPNGGLVSARKAGVAAAHGIYTGYVDGDDWVEPSYYEELYRLAVLTDADVVCSGYSRDLFDKQVRLADRIPEGVYESESLEWLWNNMMCCGDVFSIGITTYVWNKLFRAELVHGPQLAVDEHITIGEDAAVTYPTLLRAHRVCVCRNSSYHYRQRQNSMLKQHSMPIEELGQISLLGSYLRAALSQETKANGVLKQLNNFTMGLAIMRSGGALGDEQSVVFGKKITGLRIAIISAGTFGQAVYRRVAECGCCKIVGWYDEDFWEYRRYGLDVDPVNKISDKDLDVALIAKIDRHSITYIHNKLIEAGIEESKILSIENTKINVWEDNWCELTEAHNSLERELKEDKP